MDSNDFAESLLEKATVIHVQPDDVFVFSNVGDIEAGNSGLDELKQMLGGRTLVFFRGPVDIELLRDIEAKQ